MDSRLQSFKGFYNDSDSKYLLLTLTNDRPVLSSEKAPHMDRIVTFIQEEIWLDTKTD
jgi:hypothetical protein